MKLKSLFYLIILLAIQPSRLQSAIENNNDAKRYSWAIIGAGVAGITALAVLLEAGVDPSTVAWIDPEFTVGRIGKYYRNVPGNVQAHRLILYVDKCPYFKEIPSSSFDKLYGCDPDEFQKLHVIADPLMDFTNCLRNKVTPIEDTITSLDYHSDHWTLNGGNYTIDAQKVILAIGGHPRQLNYDIPEIPLDEAIDRDKLAELVGPQDRIAVFGGMHSAILILKYLSEKPVKQIINFYTMPYFYDAPGLEGVTAAWAKEVLEQDPPGNLIRVLNTTENRSTLLPMCNKVIYAIGYEPNPIIVNGSTKLAFNEDTGMIAPDLYGIGIAFPPTGIINGHTVAKNGLHTYLAYAKKLIPQWITNERFKEPISSLDIDKNPEFPWI